MAFCGIWGCFEKIDFFDFLVTQGTTLAYGVAAVLRHMYRHVVVGAGTLLRRIGLKHNVLVPFTLFHSVLWHLGMF